ncbi:DUF6249 domain-containing protein [uncultured Aquimarina sp.]|uniref:DUF6249 domain-containing protein n=1 Tax=uncultured Aquimarina sp. TaxID=575652 RepID=UPI00262A3616|nr:DUF6249 domain-containing protein [uncultured Aquimarina sp.]
MNTVTQEIIFGLMFFVLIITLVFIIARYMYLIKKALIEKGQYQDHKNNTLKYLDIGCIVFGLGVGLFVSSIFTTIELSEDTADLLIWGTILIFGAAGLIVAHFIRNRLGK